MPIPSPSKILANRIAFFLDRYDMLGGATIDEVYNAIWPAFEYHNKEEIQIIKDYFRDVRWTNDLAQELYREIDLYYS